MELKPCPFCGGEATITKHFKEDLWRLNHRCNVMGVLGIDWCWSEDRLTQQWNTRVSPEREALEKIEALGYDYDNDDEIDMAGKWGEAYEIAKAALEGK